MDSIVFLTGVNPLVNAFATAFLKEHKVNVLFPDNLCYRKPRKYDFVFQVRHFVVPSGESYYGLSFPISKRGFVKFPTRKLIENKCDRVCDWTNPLKHFSLSILHEFLHLKGLKHCKNKHCLMSKISCEYGEGNGYCLTCLSMVEAPVFCENCKKYLQISVNGNKQNPAVSSKAVSGKVRK